MRRIMLALGLGAALFAVAIVSAATLYNLTYAGASATISGAIYSSLDLAYPSGSGPFDVFINLSSSAPVVQGYNSDYRPTQFDGVDDPALNRAVLLSQIPQSIEGGLFYREFQLDINQNTTADDYLLSLDRVQIYESPFSDLCGYPFDGSGGGQAGCSAHNLATEIYSLDSAEDSFVVLDHRINDVAGRRDMKLLVPDQYFSPDPSCDFLAEGCTVYVTLYSHFGGDTVCIKEGTDTCPDNDGDELWGVPTEGPTAVTVGEIVARAKTQPAIIPAALFAALVLAAGSLLVLARKRRQNRPLLHRRRRPG